MLIVLWNGASLVNDYCQLENCHGIINFVWSKGHSDIAGNELVDYLAKFGSNHAMRIRRNLSPLPVPTHFIIDRDRDRDSLSTPLRLRLRLRLPSSCRFEFNAPCFPYSDRSISLSYQSTYDNWKLAKGGAYLKSL